MQITEETRCPELTKLSWAALFPVSVAAESNQNDFDGISVTRAIKLVLVRLEQRF